MQDIIQQLLLQGASLASSWHPNAEILRWNHRISVQLCHVRGSGQGSARVTFAYFFTFYCRVPVSAQPHQNHQCTRDLLSLPTKHKPAWEKRYSQNLLIIQSPSVWFPQQKMRKSLLPRFQRKMEKKKRNETAAGPGAGVGVRQMPGLADFCC